MLRRPSMLLALDCVPISIENFSIAQVEERIGQSFELHKGMIAFYAFVPLTGLGQHVVEEALYDRLVEYARKEDPNLLLPVSGAVYYTLSLPSCLGLPEGKVRTQLRSLGVNCLRSVKKGVVVEGGTLQSGPSTFYKSRYRSTDLHCCTLGDFSLFL